MFLSFLFMSHHSNNLEDVDLYWNPHSLVRTSEAFLCPRSQAPSQTYCIKNSWSGIKPSNLCFTTLSGWFCCMLEFENCDIRINQVSNSQCTACVELTDLRKTDHIEYSLIFSSPDSLDVGNALLWAMQGWPQLESISQWYLSPEFGD